MQAALQVDGLVRRFGAVTALDGLSFTATAGQIVGFLGPNGAGKTTAMRAIFGLTDLQAGAVSWDGRPVGRPERLRFGYMPEERGLYPDMPLAEQVAYFGRLHGMAAAPAQAAARGWLQRLGLADRAGAKIEALSHGNQQRAQLAAALVHDPELLVLDEPLSGLDPGGVDAIMAVLRERARSGCCVLLSSHQLDVVENLCDSVVIVDRGRRVAGGAVADLERSGPPRVLVRVDGDPDGAWARALPGVRISEVDQGGARLVLHPSVDTQTVLAAAAAAGRVTRFELVGRRLSEVFREATR